MYRLPNAAVHQLSLLIINTVYIHPKAGHGSAFGCYYIRVSDIVRDSNGGTVLLYTYSYTYIQRSSLNRPSCFSHSKVGHKKRPRDDRSNAGLSGFRRGTVLA